MAPVQPTKVEPQGSEPVSQGASLPDRNKSDTVSERIPSITETRESRQLSSENRVEQEPRPKSTAIKSQKTDAAVIAAPIQTTDQDTLVKEYGGIRRLSYFLSMGALGLIDAFVFSPPRSRVDYEPSLIWPLVAMAFALIFVSQRLKNIGESMLYVLLCFIPIANLWIGYKCLTQQEGYVETKELDGPGKIIRFIFILFLGFIGIAILAAFCGGRV